MNKRIIRTKLYSKIAKEVLQSVEGQLSDGMWENSPAMEKYWRFSNVETAPDGEVLIEISKDRFDSRFVHNGFVDMTDTEVIKWFAAKVKHIMQTEIVDDGHVLKKEGWSRYNDKFETQYLSYNEKITVSDVYFIYDFLLGRDTARKYSVKQHMQIEGEPRDEAATLAEVTKRENIAKLEAKYVADRKALDAQKQEQLNKIVADFEKQYDALNAKYNADRAAIQAA